MKLPALFVTCLAALAVTAFGGPSEAVGSAASAGLVQVKSRQFGQLYVHPNTDFASYRQVVIDPVPVTFRKGWNKTGSVRQRMSSADVARIADEAAARTGSIFAEVFKAQGYEIVSAPGPGVLRLSPSLHDLYVNAPDSGSAGVRSYTKEVGGATLHFEVHDAATGELLMRAVDRRQAEATQASMATSVSNRFWLETMFRRWAAACAKELATAKPRAAASTPAASG